MTPLLPLLGFALVMYVTPGPNNIMVASSAAAYGLVATLPHMAGIALGFGAMLVLVASGAGVVVLALPALAPAMRWIGVAWMIWIAWKIATAPPPHQDGRSRLLGFVGALGFQWINPKAWMIALAVAGSFLVPGAPLPPQLVRISLVFLACGIPSLLLWATLGSGMGRLLSSPARFRTFNLTMAALLVASVLPVLTGR
ncbi:MAG: LysE family translocator [Rhodospirillales bacterium]|nr:LysE family translocator [Rhodospirillales bacterium]